MLPIIDYKSQAIVQNYRTVQNSVDLKARKFSEKTVCTKLYTIFSEFFLVDFEKSLEPTSNSIDWTQFRVTKLLYYWYSTNKTGLFGFWEFILSAYGNSNDRFIDRCDR